ncbi:MAG: DUF2855 family protein [Rhodobacterales bacterium]|nr:DUF2855 family protein [Pseudomonadota bacterium]NQW13344.1 DUF2855 family protein [Rhodobacter sp.]
MKAFEIHVDRKDIRRANLVETPAPIAGPGQAVLQIEGFSLTTNNVTYAATGDIIHYWKFFPTGVDGQGIVPVWGFAHVVDSNSDALTKGARLYGFFPMASHLTITPQARGSSTVMDMAAHRKDLPVVYNTYRRVGATDPTEDAKRALFQPLLATSFLLFDFLTDNDWFKAEQIIIGSASSKTGLGLAKYLAEAKPDVPAIIGLTSDSNRAFVTSLDACDQITTYDALEGEIAQRPSVYVDMAGNADVRSRLHHHLGDNMVYSCAVGTSHWDKFTPTGDMPGSRPRFFFAPSQIEKRRADWGPGVIDRRIDEAWRRIADTSGGWMQIKTDTGAKAALKTYRDLAMGIMQPNVGHYIAL